jgi:hypothetical protein
MKIKNYLAKASSVGTSMGILLHASAGSVFAIHTCPTGRVPQHVGGKDACVGGVKPAAGGAITVGSVTKPTGFATNISSVIEGVLSFVMVIAALLVFLYLIWGGIEWITSGGDKGKTESARNKITAAVIGLVVLAASYAILQLMLAFLGFSDLNDALKINPLT